MTQTALAAQGTLYSLSQQIHDPKRGQTISIQALTLALDLADDRLALA